MMTERRLSSIIVIAATGMLLASLASYSAQTTSNLKVQDAPARVVDLNQAWGVLQDANDVGDPPLPDGYPLRMDPDIGMRLWWAGVPSGNRCRNWSKMAAADPGDSSMTTKACPCS